MSFNPLKLTYNGIALHDLGIVSVMSQSSEFSPGDLPQKETRTLKCTITAWEKETGYNYDALYAKMQAARDAIKAQNKVLTWVSPGDPNEGETQLDRPVMVVSHDLPEDGAWGIYRQVINIVFRYELDTSSDSSTLTATVTGSSGAPVTLSLGQVHEWKDDYKNNFYSEWKKIRQRSTGSISASGEIFRAVGETGAGVDIEDNRVALLLADLAELKEQVQNGKYITLTYGPEDNRFFDRDVKVESFTANINQGPEMGSIKWQLSVSYTAFPNEDSFAAADFTSGLSRDMETGRDALNISGRVVAATEALAVAKLNVLITTVLDSYQFESTKQTKRDVTKSWVNADDTQGDDETNDGQNVEDTAFIELTFTYAYEKKIADVITFTLTISDADDLKSGLITRTYSGTVVANAADEEAAYAAAVAKARSLGDKKYPFRISATETRGDRQMANQAQTEFISLEFNYQYQIKGQRMFLEMTTSVSEETFGESQERVNGYIVAKDLATARTNYASIVKALYSGRIIRNETLDEHKEYVQLGSPWTDGGGTRTVMATRLDFSLSAFKEKATGIYAIKFATRVSFDYVGLLQNSTVSGEFVGDSTQLAAIAADTTNPLKTFLASIGASLGTLMSKDLDYEKELVASAVPGSATTLSVKFTAVYQKAMSSEAQVLKCTLREELVHSGVRNIFQQTADSTDVRQACGITQGSRTVSGSCTAVTEAAAMTWITAQRAANGLFTTWYGTKPSDATRFEEPMQISTSFEFLPLLTGSTGSNRSAGTDANFQVCEKSFVFREIICNLPAPF